MKTTTLAALLTVIAAPAVLAEGDAEAGAKTFSRCKSCHSITNGEEAIVSGGRTGPDLYGVIGRVAGSFEGYNYSKDLAAAGEAGLIWDQENLAAFAADPRAFLREYLEDGGAKSKMTFKLRNGGEDITAYLASLAPAPEAEETGSEADTDTVATE